MSCSQNSPPPDLPSLPPLPPLPANIQDSNTEVAGLLISVGEPRNDRPTTDEELFTSTTSNTTPFSGEIFGECGTADSVEGSLSVLDDLDNVDWGSVVGNSAQKAPHGGAQTTTQESGFPSERPGVRRFANQDNDIFDQGSTTTSMLTAIP